MTDLKELIKKLEKDADFVKNLRKVSNKEELLKKLKAAGFELSDNDFEEFIKIVDGLELTESELEGASGGIIEHHAVMY